MVKCSFLSLSRKNLKERLSPREPKNVLRVTAHEYSPYLATVFFYQFMSTTETIVTSC